MSEQRAAKLLIRQSDLAARLGLPEHTTAHRMELDTSELDPLLELTVTGPAYPSCGGTLQRMPIGEIDDDAMERVKQQVYERHAQGLATKLVADVEVIGEIPAPGEAAVAWIGGTVIVQADDFVRADALVTSGPNGGVIEWLEGDIGKPIGRAVHAAHRGAGVKVTGFGVDPR